MTDQTTNAADANDNLASQALMQNYSGVADAQYVVSENNDGSELMQGLAQTHEQISDDYFAGSMDETFLRDGEDIAEK